jgi:hypothetical protein
LLSFLAFGETGGVSSFSFSSLKVLVKRFDARANSSSMSYRGVIWCILGQFGVIWGNLRQFGVIWGNLGQFGVIWCNLV